MLASLIWLRLSSNYKKYSLYILVLTAICFLHMLVGNVMYQDLNSASLLIGSENSQYDLYLLVPSKNANVASEIITKSTNINYAHNLPSVQIYIDGIYCSMIGATDEAGVQVIVSDIENLLPTPKSIVLPSYIASVYRKAIGDIVSIVSVYDHEKRDDFIISAILEPAEGISFAVIANNSAVQEFADSSYSDDLIVGIKLKETSAILAIIKEINNNLSSVQLVTRTGLNLLDANPTGASQNLSTFVSFATLTCAALVCTTMTYLGYRDFRYENGLLKALGISNIELTCLGLITSIIQIFIAIILVGISYFAGGRLILGNYHSIISSWQEFLNLMTPLLITMTLSTLVIEVLVGDWSIRKLIDHDD